MSAQEKTLLAHQVRVALVELTVAIKQVRDKGMEVKLMDVSDNLINAEMSVTGCLSARITETTNY